MAVFGYLIKRRGIFHPKNKVAKSKKPLVIVFINCMFYCFIWHRKLKKQNIKYFLWKIGLLYRCFYAGSDVCVPLFPLFERMHFVLKIFNCLFNKTQHEVFSNCRHNLNESCVTKTRGKNIIYVSPSFSPDICFKKEKKATPKQHT